MQTWKLFGVGLLISVLVKGCPNTAQQSTSLVETQPLQTSNTQRESGLSRKTPLSLRNLPRISPVSPLLSKGIQDFSSSSIARNCPDESEKSQSMSSQISVMPPVDKDVASHVIQQKPETDFDVSRIQANVPVNDLFHQQGLNNQGANQHTEVNALELPKVETEPRPQQENKSESLSQESLNSALRSDTTIFANEENLAPQNQRLSSPVVSLSSESASGKCNYPWELDAAGNRCGDRATSERPNSSTDSVVGSYFPPIRSYSIPTSSYGSIYVKGYFRRDGTYVRGHSRRKR
ncbi:MAG: hypothetical protein HC852_20405 [Acaryochloridaceae cyanobacterium RU_4_10]|nr:hypothetical protein [Acaryochloridaceae cyanobacterium RU_4_10]